MTEFALVPSQMASASAAASGAAVDAKRADGSDALATLAAALPGTTTAEVAPELNEAWAAGIDGWSDTVADFAASLDAATDEATGADASAGGFLGGLQGLLGGPR